MTKESMIYLLRDMRCGAEYTDVATMQIPLYERMKAAITAMEGVEAGRGENHTGSSPISPRDDNPAPSTLSSEISVLNCKFEFDTFIIEEVGPLAIAGDKISIHDAAWMAWQACWKVREPKPVIGWDPFELENPMDYSDLRDFYISHNGVKHVD